MKEQSWSYFNTARLAQWLRFTVRLQARLMQSHQSIMERGDAFIQMQPVKSFRAKQRINSGKVHGQSRLLVMCLYIFSCAKICLYSHLHIQPPLPWSSARRGSHVRAHTHMHAHTSFCLAAKADKVLSGTKYRLSVLVGPVQNHRPSGGEKKAISQMMGFR